MSSPVGVDEGFDVALVCTLLICPVVKTSTTLNSVVPFGLAVRFR